jgi:predicted enzyme related to lactoylglutathione lyase
MSASPEKTGAEAGATMGGGASGSAAGANANREEIPMVNVVEERPETRPVLADSEVVALIVYVDDLERARSFYEGPLGLHVADEDEVSVSYDTGAVRLWLRRAADDGVALPGHTDDSCDVVFLVDDVAALRAALESRGVQVSHQRTYGVGIVVDFYDPDGHRLMLYEPSDHALGTPVAGNLRDVWRSSGRGGDEVIGPAAAPPEDELVVLGLHGKPLIYFFLFIKDLGDGVEIFERQLGLRVLDRCHCCSDGCPDGEPGVVKYDGGEIILSTHHMHGHHSVLDDQGQPYAARDYDPEHAKGIAPVFRVSGIEDVVAELAARGVAFRNGIVRESAGALAGFVAPSGHLFYVFEPRV